jgi:hypothetical protein
MVLYLYLFPQKSIICINTRGFLAFLFTTVYHEVFYFFPRILLRGFLFSLTFLFYSRGLHFLSSHTHIHIYISTDSS